MLQNFEHFSTQHLTKTYLDPFIIWKISTISWIWFYFAFGIFILFFIWATIFGTLLYIVIKSFILGSLSNKIFEWHRSTASDLFALSGCGFEQILGQIFSIRVKTLSNTNLIASRLNERGKCSLPVDVCG